MHMADALLSPTVGATFWAGSIAAIGYASKKLKETIDDRMIPLIQVLGAFIFASHQLCTQCKAGTPGQYWQCQAPGCGGLFEKGPDLPFHYCSHHGRRAFLVRFDQS